MSTDRQSGAVGPMEVSCGLFGHTMLDYDRKRMRGALVKGAAVVRKEGRRLVARRAISVAGEFPGMRTGALSRAIGVVSKGSKGGWVKVGVRSIPGSVFYPAFLFYGSSKTGLQKRGNFITVALENKRDEIKVMIRTALADSLVPR
jgi:hypothetical protein